MLGQHLCGASTAEADIQREPVLGYGASSATGTIAVHLLHLSGYDPGATCSPGHFDLDPGRGAVTAFEYDDPDVAGKNKAHMGGRIRYVFDCIADDQRVTCCLAVDDRPGG